MSWVSGLRRLGCPPGWKLTRAISEPIDPRTEWHVTRCTDCADRYAALLALAAKAKALPSPEKMSRDAREAHRPDDRVTHRQSLERLRAGIEELPYDFRVVFLLCDLEGLKGTEAARALGIPEGTVWRRLHEARTRLRAFVGMESDR